MKLLPNPRKEAAENDLVVKNDQFLRLGLDPITLKRGLLSEVVDVARKYAYRVDRSRVPAVSAWTREIGQIVEHDPEAIAIAAIVVLHVWKRNMLLSIAGGTVVATPDEAPRQAAG